MQSAAGWSTHWHHWQSSSLAQEHAHSRGTWIWAHGTLKCARYVLHGRSRSLVQLHHRGTSQGAPEINSMLLVWAGALTCLGADHQSQATRQRCFRFDLASERQRDLCICTLGAEGGQSPVRRLLFTPINYPSLDLPLLRRQEEKNTNCGRSVFPRSITCRDQQIGAFLVSNVLADVCIDLQNLFNKNKNQSSSSSLSSSAAPGAPPLA